MAENKIKVVQCWDDGILDDIRLTEILRKYKARASFNLNAGLMREQRYDSWKFRDTKVVVRLARTEINSIYDGFLIASHTSTHPHLEQIAIEEARREIVDGRDALEQIAGYPVLGFAYPFGTHNAAVRELLREAGHVYARTVANVERAYPPADPMQFHPNCHFLAPDFWQRFETAKANGGVFYFWGHSYEIMDEAMWQAFDAKIARLSSDPAVEWANLPDLFA